MREYDLEASDSCSGTEDGDCGLWRLSSSVVVSDNGNGCDLDIAESTSFWCLIVSSCFDKDVNIKSIIECPAFRHILGSQP